jgi:hypothetical protein
LAYSGSALRQARQESLGKLVGKRADRSDGTLLAVTQASIWAHSALAEEIVNRILIKCPTTGKMIYTGFSMDPQTFEASPIEEMDPVQCPACRQLHRWTKKDARFERDPNE